MLSPLLDRPRPTPSFSEAIHHVNSTQDLIFWNAISRAALAEPRLLLAVHS